MPLTGHIKNGQLWTRCWECGDSPNLSHAHMAISLEGLYRCVRCGTSGKLSSAQFLKLFQESDIKRLSQVEYNPNNFYDIYERLLPGPGSSRFSLLERYHLATERGNQDCFVITNALGDPIGIQLCTPKKKMIIGHKGIAWPGGENEVTSTRKHPLFLVEGPYDVGYQNEVACFGLPDISVMRMLRGQYIVLVPDPDVWKDEYKLGVIQKSAMNTFNMVLGVIILTSGKDPDETPLEDRLFIPLKDLNWGNNLAHKMK